LTLHRSPLHWRAGDARRSPTLHFSSRRPPEQSQEPEPRSALTASFVVTRTERFGQSSLAFDTLFAEGQRRYIETFFTYARQFFDRLDKTPRRSHRRHPARHRHRAAEFGAHHPVHGRDDDRSHRLSEVGGGRHVADFAAAVVANRSVATRREPSGKRSWRQAKPCRRPEIVRRHCPDRRPPAARAQHRGQPASRV